MRNQENPPSLKKKNDKIIEPEDDNINYFTAFTKCARCLNQADLILQYFDMREGEKVQDFFCTSCRCSLTIKCNSFSEETNSIWVDFNV